jgi:hypothetical protein
MDELIKKLQEKAKACGDNTREDRARKGAYIDCIVEMKALRKHAVSNRYTLEDMKEAYNAGENNAGSYTYPPFEEWFRKR